MNELKGQTIRIVLNLKQGRGFGLIGLENLAGITGVFIEATLNGSSLATDVFPLGSEPVFDSELMWESDKKSLRRLRTDIATVKVQCFATDEQQQRKERIGQFVINIRQANIVPSGKPSAINEKWWSWYKLAGGKSPIPEVLCNLRLEERPQTPEPSVSAEKSLAFASQSKHEQTSLPATKYHPDSNVVNIEPDDTNTNAFLLTIQCTAAKNFDGVLSRYLSKEQDPKEQMHFSYKILNQEVMSPALHLNDISASPLGQVHDDVSITVHSTIKSLHHCLEKSPKLSVKLRTGEADLAIGEADLKTLIPSTDLKRFHARSDEYSASVKELCYFQELITGDFGEEPRPQVTISVTLKLIGSKGEESLPKAQSSTSMLSSNGRNSESPVRSNKEMEPNISLIRSDTYVLDDESRDSKAAKEGARLVRSTTYTVFDPPAEAKDNPTIQNIFIRKPPNDHKSTQTLLEDQPHLYVLHIALTDVTFNQVPINPNICFRFHHPKMNLLNEDSTEISISEINREIALYSINCRLRFVATPQNIGQLLKAHPPTISVFYTLVDKPEDLAHATLDPGPLLIDYKQKKSYYKTLLVDANSMTEIGAIGVQMYLHDEGLYKETEEPPAEEITEADLGPPVLEDSLAHKILEELEKWKEQQKRLYEMQLKKKEDAHLAALTAEWKKRRSELESNLIQKKEEFATVAQNLKDATEEIRLSINHNKEKEMELKKLKAMLFQKQKAKLKQLSEPLKDLEAGLGSKMGMIENNMQKLQETITKLEQENSKLRETLADQEEELDRMRKTGLTKDQTASLLQELKSIEEKLENALKSKAFFKEQWAKAVREIHKIRSEHQRIIQTQVRKNMEALQKYGVQHLLESDSTLPETQPLGPDILRKINAMKGNNGIGDSNEHIKEFVPTPHRIRASQSMHSLHSTKSFSAPTKDHSKIEAKLKALVEERDSLLQTGSYTLEDPVVFKLNNEIRSLLIHSNGVA